MNRLSTSQQQLTRGPRVSFERARGIYALHVTRDVAHAKVQLKECDERIGATTSILNALAKANIAIFLIKLHKSGLTFALAGSNLSRAEATLSHFDVAVTTRRDLAVVAIIAGSMREVSGIMTDISDALLTAGATIYETGDSHDSVQCLIEEDRLNDSISRLLDTFELPESAVEEHPLYANTRDDQP